VNHILAAVTSQNGQLHITFVPSIVAGKLMIVGTCRNHRGNHIEAADLVLPNNQSCRSTRYLVITQNNFHGCPVDCLLITRLDLIITDEEGYH
jgi:hypothetical protein